MKPLNQYIDHTNIKPEATEADILNTIEEAKKYNLRGICVRAQWVKLVSTGLEGTEIKTTLIVDDPIGDATHEERMAICEKAKADGSNELDIVMNIPDVKHERWDKIKADLSEICKILPTKIIIGSGYLNDVEIAEASKIVKEVGAICVKTATDKDPLQNRELKEKAIHLKMMRENAPGLLVKASGNIHNYDDAKMMIEAGADIIGTSSSVKIMEESYGKQ